MYLHKNQTHLIKTRCEFLVFPVTSRQLENQLLRETGFLSPCILLLTLLLRTLKDTAMIKQLPSSLLCAQMTYCDPACSRTDLPPTNRIHSLLASCLLIVLSGRAVVRLLCSTLLVAVSF